MQNLIVSIAVLFSLLAFPLQAAVSESQLPAEQTELSATPLWGERPFKKPTCVKGIHLTAWAAGSTKFRAEFEPILQDTEINTVVIGIKEINGDIYIPGVEWDKEIYNETWSRENKPYKSAIRDLEAYLVYLKARGIFTIARITVFQDQILPKVKPEWAVQSSTPIPRALKEGFDGNVWVDRRGLAWTDPYNKEVRKYNIAVAVRAAQLGFQGIQFDYIRFPSDGNVAWCQYSQPHSAKNSYVAISNFLKEAEKALAPYGIELSIDTFGLAGSIKDGLGIGQKISDIIDHIDVLSPMMYPSHYAKGEYGIKNPNESPYETVFRSVNDTLKIIDKTEVTLRPFLQDFSLGVKYDKEKIKDQIRAVEENGVYEWLFWNPRCHYTWEGFKPAQED